jgi:predicted phosphodiesterase
MGGGGIREGAGLRSLVISDLHLGTASGADLLRYPEHRRPLIERLHDIDRLVILGDGIELREIPARTAAQHIRPLLEEASAHVGEVVMVPGNHDYALINGWIETRLQQEQPPTLSLTERIEPKDAGPVAEHLAGYANLTIAYPGIRLRDDVFATHGHYADLHTRVPTFERLAVGAMMRYVAPLPERATPEDYEVCLAPLYAWMHALAQRARPGAVHAGQGASARTWVRLAESGPRALLLKGGCTGAVAFLNRIGIGPVQRDVSGPALRVAYLDAINEVKRRLGIDAEHLIWGHSHRPGPLPRDDPREWAGIVNSGSWVLQRHFLKEPGSPYRPGTAVLVEESGPPQVIRLVGDPA